MSRRLSVLILEMVFDAMNQALARGEEVEFPFGLLYRVKHVSRRWELAEDEPMEAHTVEHDLDAAGYKVLFGADGSAELDLLSRRRPVKRSWRGLKLVPAIGK